MKGDQFSLFRDYLNKIPLGTVISRANILKDFSNYQISKGSVDRYLAQLTKWKYLNFVDNGLYRVVQRFTKDITMGELRLEIKLRKLNNKKK